MQSNIFITRWLTRDAVDAAYFRRHGSGRTVFFPLGANSFTFRKDRALVTGYVVPTPAAAERMIRLIQCLRLADGAIALGTLSVVVWALAFPETFPPGHEHQIKALSNILVVISLSLTWLRGRALTWAVRRWETVETDISQLEWRQLQQQSYGPKHLVAVLLLIVLVLFGMGYYQLVWVRSHPSFLVKLPLLISIPSTLLLTALLLNPKSYRLSIEPATTSVPIAERGPHRQRLLIAAMIWSLAYAVVALIWPNGSGSANQPEPLAAVEETLWVDRGAPQPDLRLRLVRSVYPLDDKSPYRLAIAWQLHNDGDTDVEADPSSYVVVDANAAASGDPRFDPPQGPKVRVPAHTTSPVMIATIARNKSTFWHPGSYSQWRTPKGAANPVAVRLAPYAVASDQLLEVPPTLEDLWPVRLQPADRASRAFVSAQRFSLLIPRDSGCDWVRQTLGEAPKTLAHFSRNCSRLPLSLHPDGKLAVLSRGHEVTEVALTSGQPKALPLPGAKQGAVLAAFNAAGQLEASVVPLGVTPQPSELLTYRWDDTSWHETTATSVLGDVSGLYFKLADQMARSRQPRMLHAGMPAAGEGYPYTVGDAYASYFTYVSRAVATQLTKPSGLGLWLARATAAGPTLVAWSIPRQGEALVPLTSPVYAVRGDQVKRLDDLALGTPVALTVCGRYVVIGGGKDVLPQHAPDAREWPPAVATDLLTLEAASGSHSERFAPAVLEVQCWP